MGKPNEAPPPSFDGITNTRSTLPQAVPHSQDYVEVHHFPPSQPNAPNVQNFPPSHSNAPNVQNFPTSHSNPSPMPFMPNQLPTQPWRTGLFDCMQDPTNAIITACFPCVTFGQIAELADSGASSCATSGMWYSLISFCIAMPCIMSCTYRTKMRTMFGIVESPAPDWVVHCFCEWCALCQEYRELKERGYDPTIGWAGNMAIQRQRQASMAPPMQQRMM